MGCIRMPWQMRHFSSSDSMSWFDTLSTSTVENWKSSSSSTFYSWGRFSSSLLLFCSLSGCSSTLPRRIVRELSIISVVLFEWWLLVIFLMLEMFDMSGHRLSMFSTWNASGGAGSLDCICFPSRPLQNARALARIFLSYSSSILVLFCEACIMMSFRESSFWSRSSVRIVLYCCLALSTT